MGFLSNDEFLVSLQALFDAQKDKGTVFVTMKRYTFEGPAAQDVEGDTAMDGESSAQAEAAWPCLVRATDGETDKKKKTKLSTVVQPADVEAFAAAYGAVLKANMTGLRKKRKKGAVASKKPTGGKGQAAAAASTQPRRFVPTLPKVIGPRRGAGVKLRRRREAAKMAVLKRFWKISKTKAARAKKTKPAKRK